MSRLFLLLGTLLVLAACDTQDPVTQDQDKDPTDDTLPRLTSQRTQSVALETFGLRMDQHGFVTSGDIIGSETSGVYAIYSGGLWISGLQNGALRSNGVYGASALLSDGTYAFRSNLGPCSDSTGGVFRVSSDTTYSATGWPTDAGAPVQVDGAPMAYGDQMLWTSMCSISKENAPDTDWYSAPLQGLRVNQSVFTHDAETSAVFIRYEITNESNAPMQEVYVGFKADPDWKVSVDNMVGYDASTSMSYVYNDAHKQSASGSVPRPDAERGEVLGLTVLETPRALGITSHRAVLKSVPFDNPFKEYGLTAEANRNILMGLLNDGSPQVGYSDDSHSGLFAYTGDSVAETGWIDGFMYEGRRSGWDVRQIVSTGPFDIAPGETVTYTLAYVTQSGSDLGDGLRLLKQHASRLQSQPSLWRFPVES